MSIIMHDRVNNYKLNDHLEDTKVCVPFTKSNAEKCVLLFYFSAEKSACIHQDSGFK